MTVERAFTDSSGKAYVSDKPIDLEGLGDITVGTSEVELDFSGATEEIRIQADSGNSGTIYIGKTGVLSDGTNDFVRLSAGDEITFGYNDISNAIYLISDVAAQAVNASALITK